MKKRKTQIKNIKRTPKIPKKNKNTKKVMREPNRQVLNFASSMLVKVVKYSCSLHTINYLRQEVFSMSIDIMKLNSTKASAEVD